MPGLKFADGLIPVIVQDTKTCAILMMAYANEEEYGSPAKPVTPTTTAGAGKNSGRKARRAVTSRRSCGSLWTATRTALSMKSNKRGSLPHGVYVVLLRTL